MAGALEHQLGGGGVVEVAEVGLPHQLPVTTQELWQSFEYFIQVPIRFYQFYYLYVQMLLFVVVVVVYQVENCLLIAC